MMILPLGYLTDERNMWLKQLAAIYQKVHTCHHLVGRLKMIKDN